MSEVIPNEQGYLERLPLINKVVVNRGTLYEAEITIKDAEVFGIKYTHSWLERFLGRLS